MSEAELREKIARAICQGNPCVDEVHVCDRDVEDGMCRPGFCVELRFGRADAILALVHPAIQAARVEALREAEKVAARLNMIPANCEYGSVEWDTNAGVCRLETRGGSCQCLERAEGAEAVEKAIAVLIEKETAP